MPKRILFISGSIGLGHVARDIAIAGELRRLNPETEIIWLAEPPADSFLEREGERVHPAGRLLASSNEAAEKLQREYSVDIVEVALEWLKIFPKRLRVYEEIVENEKIDLVVGDETYDITVERFLHARRWTDYPFIMLVDCVGVRSMRPGLISRVKAYLFNFMWCNIIRARKPRWSDYIFLGVPEDVPDIPFGPFLPNRRETCRKHLDFTGYILSFDPAEYSDTNKIRRELGYSPDPLVVCTIGGTNIAKPLLDLCRQAHPFAKKRIPNLKMVLVSGPRLEPASIPSSEGLIIRGFVPRLYQHLAAADLAITAGGGTTTLELTALLKPFLYFPLEGHTEQQYDVAERCERLQAGVKMGFSETTPEILAEAIVGNISATPRYHPILLSGALWTAELINEKIKKIG